MACAHRSVSIAILGSDEPALCTSQLFCHDDHRGKGAVKAWATREAAKRGLAIDKWESLTHSRDWGWSGEVRTSTLAQPKHSVQVVYVSTIFGSEGKSHTCTTVRGIARIVGDSISSGGWSWVVRGTKAALTALGAYESNCGWICTLPDGRTMRADVVA